MRLATIPGYNCRFHRFFNKLNDLEFCIPVSIFLITCTSSSQKLDEVVIIVCQAIYVYVELSIS